MTLGDLMAQQKALEKPVDPVDKAALEARLEASYQKHLAAREAELKQAEAELAALTQEERDLRTAHSNSVLARNRAMWEVMAEIATEGLGKSLTLAIKPNEGE